MHVTHQTDRQADNTCIYSTPSGVQTNLEHFSLPEVRWAQMKHRDTLPK